jgi:hypothetical protein
MTRISPEIYVVPCLIEMLQPKNLPDVSDGGHVLNVAVGRGVSVIGIVTVGSGVFDGSGVSVGVFEIVRVGDCERVGEGLLEIVGVRVGDRDRDALLEGDCDREGVASGLTVSVGEAAGDSL